jgi:hypothetical protein
VKPENHHAWLAIIAEGHEVSEIEVKGEHHSAFVAGFLENRRVGKPSKPFIA